MQIKGTGIEENDRPEEDRDNSFTNKAELIIKELIRTPQEYYLERDEVE